MVKKKDDFLMLRISTEEKERVENLAKETYGFSNTSEFLRYAIAYIREKQPILGKSFAPGSLNS